MDLFDVRSFTLGMLALLNPCGFALLPAYLGYFLGTEQGADDHRQSRLTLTLTSLNRAQLVGLSMSAGFLVVFGLIGVVFAGSMAALSSSGWLERITVLIGSAMVALGIAMLGGYQPLLSIPKLNKGGSSRSIGSMFLFGVSYALASLGCTIGLFVTTIGTSASGATFGARMGSFLSYAIGMGLLATMVTVAVGFGQKRFVNKFRAATGRINTISAVIMLVVGVYLMLYGIWSFQVFNGLELTPWINAIVTTAEGWQVAITSWLGSRVNLFGLLEEPVRRTSILGGSFVVINIALGLAGFFARQSGSPDDTIAPYAPGRQNAPTLR